MVRGGFLRKEFKIKENHLPLFFSPALKGGKEEYDFLLTLQIMDKINNMHYGSSSFTFEKAVELRKRITKAEAVLWEELRNKRFMGLKFRQQHPIDRFIVDFYCHKHKLVIELDGSVHDLPEVAENDKNREAELTDLGLTILRFSNSIVLQSIQAVLNTIAKFISSTEKNSDALFHPLGRGKEKSGRILGNSTPPASAALALLIFNNPDYTYVEPVKEFSMDSQRKARPQHSSIIEPVETKLIKLYPNPAHDYITLEYNNVGQYSSLSYSLNDQSGKMLLNQKLNTQEREVLIDLSSLKAGVYTLIIYGDNNIIETHKITIIN